jgi:ankyrin repeat protein
LYSRLVFLGSITIAVLSAASVARAADSERCQELTRRFEDAKPQINAMEVSRTLFSAVDGDCIALTTELLDYGASLDARDRFGARPLSHAARSGHLEMVDLLLARALRSMHAVLPTPPPSILLPKAAIRRSCSGLSNAAPTSNSPGRSGISPIATGNDAIVEALRARGADERAPDETGKPPIVYASAKARLDIVKRLLARNIDINARCPNDLTLLMWASGPDEKVPEAQAMEVVSYLLDAGAHIDVRDNRGRTALMIAAEGGHAEIANLLLARGANASLRDKAGKRAADLTVLSSLRERLTPP